MLVQLDNQYKQKLINIIRDPEQKVRTTSNKINNDFFSLINLFNKF
jgi:hypothetical protein